MSPNDDHDENQSDSILYELIVHSEWVQDYDGSGPKPWLTQPQSGWSKAGVKSILGSWNILKKQNWICEEISDLMQSQSSWRFCVSADGKVAAILQETYLEVRISRDEYSSVIGKASVPLDPHPQWRKLAWSPDNSLLAVAYSSGTVCLYDLLASNVATISPTENVVEGNKYAVACLLFIKPKMKNTKWPCELLIVDYRGDVRSYYVSAFEGCQENMKCSLASYYPFGIASVVYHPSHHILIVSGAYSPSVSTHGLSVWRILTDHPFIRLAVETPKASPSSSLWRFIPRFSNTDKQDIILKMKISPNGQLLVCIHSFGTISVWHLPSMRLHKHWPLCYQPDHHVCILQNNETLKSEKYFYPADVDWWSDQVFIIGRRSGAVSVCDISTLRNLLGKSPEFLSGVPQIASIHSGRPAFLALECEVTSAKNKSRLDDSDQESEDNSETSVLQANIQAAIYSMTDLETFQPKRKPLKLVQKTYRLIGLKSTTPEELYSRKIDNEEYDDALSLAQLYNLDTDLVYQRRWRISNVSEITIDNYLGKIKNLLWVANECVERVPDTTIAAKALLEFGLKITEVHEDDRVIDSFTTEQHELMIIRRQLLKYLDNLAIYEKIIDMPCHYDPLNYEEFRKAPSIVSATKYAREENWQAVSIMFTFRGKEVLSHWLPVLSNFPETLMPPLYRSLFPEIVGTEPLPWETRRLRFPDWCEDEPFHKKETDVSNDSDFLYKDEPELQQFMSDNLSVETVTQWYIWRTYQIEERTLLVEHALNLVKLAKEKNIKGLDKLYTDLLTLEALVYFVQDDGISLRKLESLTILEQARLLLSKTRPETFVTDVKNLLLPFMLRCDKLEHVSKTKILHDLLVQYSENDLELPLKLLEHLRDIPSSAISIPIIDKIAIALDCLYACPKEDQLENAYSILECLPDRSSGSSAEEEKLHDKIDLLEKHLSVCEILARNGVPKSLKFIKDNSMDVKVGHELLESVAENVKKNTLDFTDLQTDLLDIRANAFTLINIDYCYEVFALAQLSCECEEIIQSAEAVISCRQGDIGKMINFDKSVELVLKTAREHFDRASNVDDPCIKLAQTCLTLINQSHHEICEELDLIESLQLLGEFHVTILPVQVRICPDRIKMIEACLKVYPKAYKHCERLLQLAQALRISGDDRQSREGQVLTIIAEYALKSGDFQQCSEVCSRLIGRNYRPAWVISKTLAQCDKFHNIKQKLSLLAFSILHCPLDAIEDLVEFRYNLRTNGESAVLKTRYTEKFINNVTDSNSL